MAAAGYAIELPTNRQSRFFDTPTPDVHDPNYIPVLNGIDPKVDFSTPSFYALPSIPKPHKDQAQTSLKRTKSDAAPEIVVRNHDAHPVPSQRSTTSPQATAHEIGSSHTITKDDGNPETQSEDTTATSSTPSTVGTTSMLEEQIYTIPGNTAPKPEEIQFPAVPVSARSSMSFSRKSTVPTSRYNKKSLPSIPSIPTTALLNRTPTPLASQRSSPEPVQTQSVATSPRQVPIPPPIEHSPSLSSPRLHAAKSTASERRARALHSHPSKMSLKSKANLVLDETDEAPLVASTDTRRSASRTRSHSIASSHQPTPAPDAPLPDLPPHAKRSPTREKPIEKPPLAHITSSSLPPDWLKTSQNEHVEMAEFMATRKTTVFRRFDDVHVRLLLHLQDEISALETELLKLEDAGPERPDKIIGKTNIMQELRKALVEYGEFCQIVYHDSSHLTVHRSLVR